MDLSLTTREVRGVLVMDMSGRLSVLDQNFRQAVLLFLKAGHRHFVLKMTDLSYIDSSGLGQLVSVYTSLSNVGGSVQLLAPSSRVRELLDITKLDTVFDIIEDETRIAKSGSNVA